MSLKILLELRPAMDGHAGIPQETRLLFHGLRQLEGLEVDGLLQASSKVLARGLPARSENLRWSEDRRVDRLSRVVVSLQGGGETGPLVRVRQALRSVRGVLSMMAWTLLGRAVTLTRFEARRFEDFLWRSLFAKTLSPDHFESVTRAGYRVATVPWSAAHLGALLLRISGRAVYPRIDTRDYDLMLAETPYPGRVSASTRLVVRYHDAIPVLMPHTISDRSHHQAAHFHALRRNVRDGAWFACVSEATRRDLISIFPEAEQRSVTIFNIVSQHYFREDSTPERIPQVLRLRGNTEIDALAGRRSGDPLAASPSELKRGLPFLLMVSTLEPRKNHMALQEAWEKLRADGHPNLRLVFVGALGWDSDDIVRKLLPWVGQGLLHVLDDVPAADLRLLYRHARATVCPSFGEGFGFSGVEAMRCGGAVVASDLPVHREIYGDAAEYFNPYSVDDLASALRRVLSDAEPSRRDELERLGAQVAERYVGERVLPEWQAFFNSIASRP